MTDCKKTSVDSGYDEDGLVAALEEMVVSTDGESDDTLAVTDPEKITEVWPEPSPSFITEQAKKFKLQLLCRICSREGEPSDLVLCGGCGAPHMPAHKRCLASSPLHQPGLEDDEATMYGGPCDEVALQEFIYTTWLLDSRFLDKDKTSLHADDLWSTWFGVPHDQTGRYPQLRIYPRLERLIGAAPDRPPRQYPSLVSFVGDTGSGKSTLIRAMIRLLAPREHKNYRVPVPGAASDGFDSTSSDVHIFSDPKTLATEVPLFFVDCEGFSGTDTPISRQLLSDAARSQASPALTEAQVSHGQRDAPVSKALRDGTLRAVPTTRPTKELLTEHEETASAKIDLKWGQLLAPVDSLTGHSRRTLGQVDSNTRKIVVKTIYPRLLYSFSDVVCFVTNNSRASQNILEEMFKWAKDGHEKTLNQRVRPGLLIVLNKMASETHDVLSSVSKATTQLLDSFQKSARFGELQARWRLRGRQVETAEELILCYYDSFRVISIPQHTRTSPATVKEISAQIKALYHEIGAMSSHIRKKRQSLNMDLDVSSLSACLQLSANALGRDYKNSLDFHVLADSDSALPRRFSEHLVQLMSSMVTLRNIDTSQAVGGEADLVSQMTPYIAACIMAQVDDRDVPDKEQKRKDDLVDEARRGLEQFRNRFWRCEAKSPTGHWRCKNYWYGHDKGHQFDHSSHRLSRLSDVSDDDNIQVGNYTSSFDLDSFTDHLWEEVSKIRGREQSVEKLASAATACGVAQVTGQRTCLACLSNTPTNMLPCRPKQHGICEDCIRRYNRTNSEDSVIQINSCPLGCSLSKVPWIIRIKPRTAGARILALDGGGIRGIVELVILYEIERAVGMGIRIQELFDLVIGTSTGGIVALGVFERNWTLHEAERQFRELSHRAFSLRKALKIPVLSMVAEPFCDYKYKSAGIVEALKEAFHDRILFGQTGQTDSNRDNNGDQTKVGVITCLEGRLQPCLVANYSRNPIDRLKDGREAYDCLQREDEQSKDFLTWQAARATSAAQTLFKPYVHEPTQRTYVDGATVRNNPVRIAFEEDRRIWRSNQLPDIIVSLGTGILVDKEGTVMAKKSDHLEQLKRLLPKGFRKKVETGIDMVEATLDCHREWVDFNSAFRSPMRRNFHRLDVGLTSKPPSLDAVEDMYNLAYKARDYLQRWPGRDSPRYFRNDYSCAAHHILAVARRLRASLFYLAHTINIDAAGGAYESTLHCRLMPNSEAVPALLAAGPIFRLREISAGGEETVRPVRFLSEGRIDQSTLSGAVELHMSKGVFERIVEVQFPRGSKDWEPIAGF